jgi:hypothetical protein
MQINRVCLPENYTDFFFIDLHQRFHLLLAVEAAENQTSLRVVERNLKNCKKRLKRLKKLSRSS